jgi:hypothetical protein
MSDRTVSAYQRRTTGRQGQVIDAIIERASGIDTDILAVMDKRDTTMIEEEILHGAGSSKYVYSFKVSGKAVAGISVVGARELATHYGGMQHEIVASVSKVGRLLVITQYPQDGVPMDIRFQRVPELEEEPDFYECLVRIKDIKTGNSTQARKKEYRLEERSERTLQDNPGLDRYYARPHYDTIAESKAYRNAILNLIPQNVQIKWKEEMLKLEKSEIITVSVIDEKRSGVLRYAASKAIAVDREAVEALTYEQIMGLSDAVREGKAEQFVGAADALGIIIAQDTEPRVVAATSRTPINRQTDQTRQGSNGATQTGNGAAQTNAEQREAPAEQQEQKPRKQSAKKQDGPPAGHPAAGDEQQGKAASQVIPVEETKPVETKPAEEVKQVEEPTGFDHYALDEFGEPIADADGVLKHFTDPRDFALWYNDHFLRSSNQQALKENNEDARQDAMADPAAKVILDAVDNPIDITKPAEVKEDPVKQEGPKPVALSTLPNNRTNWPKFANACEADLKTKQSDAEIDKWLVLNSPTYAGKAISAQVDSIVKARRAQIAAAPQADTDMEQALDLVKRLNEVKFEHEYNMLISNAAIRSYCKRMTAERPDDIRKMITDAEAGAQFRIKQHPPQEAAGRQPDEKNPPAEDEIPWDRMGDRQ